MHSQTTDAEADADMRFAERLLRGGVAPRHVRRCLRELRDHRSDILQQLERQGLQPIDAVREAQLLLGHRDAIAEQILARPELRSRARRFAWLLFGVMPIFGTVALSLAVFFAALAASSFTPGFAVHASLTPADVPPVVHILTRWAPPVGIAMFLVSVALKRRFSPPWPVIGIVLTALIAAGTWIEPHGFAVGLPRDTGRAVVLICGLLAAYVLADIAIRTRRPPVS